MTRMLNEREIQFHLAILWIRRRFMALQATLSNGVATAEREKKRR
jgi:hypothetical protein